MLENAELISRMDYLPTVLRCSASPALARERWERTHMDSLLVAILSLWQPSNSADDGVAAVCERVRREIAVISSCSRYHEHLAQWRCFVLSFVTINGMLALLAKTASGNEAVYGLVEQLLCTALQFDGTVQSVRRPSSSTSSLSSTGALISSSAGPVNAGAKALAAEVLDAIAHSATHRLYAEALSSSTALPPSAEAPLTTATAHGSSRGGGGGVQAAQAVVCVTPEEMLLSHMGGAAGAGTASARRGNGTSGTGSSEGGAAAAELSGARKRSGSVRMEIETTGGTCEGAHHRAVSVSAEQQLEAVFTACYEQCFGQQDNAAQPPPPLVSIVLLVLHLSCNTGEAVHREGSISRSLLALAAEPRRLWTFGIDLQAAYDRRTAHSGDPNHRVLILQQRFLLLLCSGKGKEVAHVIQQCQRCLQEHVAAVAASAHELARRLRKSVVLDESASSTADDETEQRREARRRRARRARKSLQGLIHGEEAARFERVLALETSLLSHCHCHLASDCNRGDDGEESQLVHMICGVLCPLIESLAQLSEAEQLPVEECAAELQTMREQAKRGLTGLLETAFSCLLYACAHNIHWIAGAANIDDEASQLVCAELAALLNIHGSSAPGTTDPTALWLYAPADNARRSTTYCSIAAGRVPPLLLLFKDVFLGPILRLRTGGQRDPEAVEDERSVVVTPLLLEQVEGQHAMLQSVVRACRSAIIVAKQQPQEQPPANVESSLQHRSSYLDHLNLAACLGSSRGGDSDSSLRQSTDRDEQVTQLLRSMYACESSGTGLSIQGLIAASTTQPIAGSAVVREFLHHANSHTRPATRMTPIGMLLASLPNMHRYSNSNGGGGGGGMALVALQQCAQQCLVTVKGQLQQLRFHHRLRHSEEDNESADADFQERKRRKLAGEGSSRRSTLFPADVWVLILQYSCSSYRRLCRLSRVCREFHGIIHSDGSNLLQLRSRSAKRVGGPVVHDRYGIWQSLYLDGYASCGALLFEWQLHAIHAQPTGSSMSKGCMYMRRQYVRHHLRCGYEGDAEGLAAAVNASAATQGICASDPHTKSKLNAAAADPPQTLTQQSKDRMDRYEEQVTCVDWEREFRRKHAVEQRLLAGAASGAPASHRKPKSGRLLADATGYVANICCLVGCQHVIRSAKQVETHLEEHIRHAAEVSERTTEDAATVSTPARAEKGAKNKGRGTGKGNRPASSLAADH